MEAQDVNTELQAYIKKVLMMHGQDLFLKTGAVPRVRVGAHVLPLPFPEVDEKFLKEFAVVYLNDAQKKLFDEHKCVDFSFGMPDLRRYFRGNLFLQRGHLSLVVRVLWQQIPSFEELGIPAILKSVILQRAGLILIAGTVGSGKTTTMHAMIEVMNQSAKRHILTIEDPIEYLHKDKECLVQQREIGQDTKNFDEALKHVVRQAPDVIVLGEIRDKEAFHFAMNAAEVGRLVMATIHAKNVTQIFERLLGFFPAEQHDTILSHLCPNILCLSSQKLLPAKDNRTMAPAFEILVGNYTIQQLIKEKRFDKIPQALRNGEPEGMCTMDQSLLALWREGILSSETVREAAERPQEIENIMRGIQIDGHKGKILGSD